MGKKTNKNKADQSALEDDDDDDDDAEIKSSTRGTYVVLYIMYIRYVYTSCMYVTYVRDVYTNLI